jgi:hypothetical protein
MGRLDEAKTYFEQAVDIYGKIYGKNHHNLAALLNNLAGLLRNQVCLFVFAECCPNVARVFPSSIVRSIFAELNVP